MPEKFGQRTEQAKAKFDPRVARRVAHEALIFPVLSPWKTPTKAPTKRHTKVSTQAPTKVPTRVFVLHLSCFHLFCSRTREIDFPGIPWIGLLVGFPVLLLQDCGDRGQLQAQKEESMYLTQTQWPSHTVFSMESDSVVFCYSVWIYYALWYSKSVHNVVIRYIFSSESLRIVYSLQIVNSLRVGTVS